MDSDLHAQARAGDAVMMRWWMVGMILVGCAPHVEEDVIAGAVEEVVIPAPVRPVIEDVQLGIVDCPECRPDPLLTPEESALVRGIETFARALATCRRPGTSAVAVRVHDADGHLRLEAKHPGDEMGEACFIEAMLAFATPTTWKVEFTISRRAAGGG